MGEKKEKKVYVTPAGVAAYAWIARPDLGVSKFSDGKYKITLLMDPDDPKVVELKAAAFAVAREKWPKVKPADIYLPFQNGDKIADKKDGKAENFRGKVVLQAKSQFKSSVLDAKRNPVLVDVIVMLGDLVKVVFILYVFDGKDWGVIV